MIYYGNRPEFIYSKWVEKGLFPLYTHTMEIGPFSLYFNNKNTLTRAYFHSILYSLNLTFRTYEYKIHANYNGTVLYTMEIVPCQWSLYTANELKIAYFNRIYMYYGNRPIFIVFQYQKYIDTCLFPWYIRQFELMYEYVQIFATKLW